MSIGVFQAAIILLLFVVAPTVIAVLVLRMWLRGLWILALAPLPAVIDAGALIFVAKMLESGAPAFTLPEGSRWMAIVLLATWLLALLITVGMMGVLAARARTARTSS